MVLGNRFTFDIDQIQGDFACSRVSTKENGQTMVLAYDAFGNLAAEYGQNGLAMCGTATCYLTMDHLGSTRMLTDSAGVVQRRFDYLPIGELVLLGGAG